MKGPVEKSAGFFYRQKLAEGGDFKDQPTKATADY